MTNHTVGTRDEWDAASKALQEREARAAELERELAEQRRALPWVPVEKQYTFETDAGPKTLAQLFDGRSQLLAYNLMFGPDYEAACPGCTGLADHLDAALVHLEHNDVTLIAISRAPLVKLQAYKRRMGWRFPWVSSNGSDYAFDFGFAATEEQKQTGELAKMIAEPPDFLREWAVSVGTDIPSGITEGPGFIAFALQDGVVYHTYSRHTTGGAFAPYHYQLLDQTPHGRGDELKAVRHDEYEHA